MRLLLIGAELDTSLFRAALEGEGCEYSFVPARALGKMKDGAPTGFDAAIVSRDHGDHEKFGNNGLFSGIPVVAAIGADNIAANIGTLCAEDNALCNEYTLYGGEENIRNLIRFIGYKLSKCAKPPLPTRVAFDSIYDFEGNKYESCGEYFERSGRSYENYVGILSYRTHWQNGDTECEKMLQDALCARGIGAICAFSTGNPDAELGCLSMESAIERFFTHNGKPAVGALVNFMLFGTAYGDGDSLFERAANCFARLNVPVVRPAQSNRLTNVQWQKSDAPFRYDAALAFDTPEMQGMTETVFIGGRDDAHTHTPIPERIEKLADRLAKLIRLKSAQNSEKRVAFMLNSAVCSGVEATLGRASGLDAFSSVASVLHRLWQAGYDTGGAEKLCGSELRELVLSKKAYSDFRWTSAEDIESSGGALYKMPLGEYLKTYSRVDAFAREKIEEMWGKAPGEAMALDNELLITGLRFGNVLLMIQPKRGCHGAKCTGEVCKILQDPLCPPTHQYIATYGYIEHIFKADAIVHFGTHGSLEYLPGKANGMGSACYPDIVIGSLPNFYIFNASAAPQALLAKRRSYAVTIDHEPKRDELHALDGAELDALMNALSGGFVFPGKSGTHEDMPFETGRNMYGVRLDMIPSREAYARGAEAAEQLLSAFYAAEGRYMEQTAVSLIALDIPRTGGEQLSQALSLMGIRPVWNERGIVKGLEAIPLRELRRPRTDVMSQISSVLRDAWPDVLSFLDEGVMLAASLDESDEDNYIVKHTRGMELTDIPRIFGGAPGTYTNAVGLALKASAWRDGGELARVFIDSSSYVFGKGKDGRKNVAAFLDGVKRTDATADIISMRHTDALNSSYSSRIQGSFALAAEYIGMKTKPRAFMAESGGDGVKVKTLEAHLRDGLYETMLDSEWQARMKSRGYDGAAEIMCRMQNIFDMQCVNESFDDKALDELARQYAANDDMREWLESVNPFAAEESTRRLLEMAERGKWNADGDVLQALRRDYLKCEAKLEDGMSGLGEVQAGSVDILTSDDVSEWKNKLRSSDEEIAQWKKRGS